MSKYLDSGVDIASADKLVGEIKQLSQETKSDNVISEIGGFGAVFDLYAAGHKYRSPLLVSSTDGVGTKLLIAQDTGQHQHIGVDLVAMCVNDVLAQGAKPLFFLDYFATGALDPSVALEVLRGISHGCKLAGASLVGGETAEMPGMYSRGHYDLAGFTVGIVERDDILPKLDLIQAGDVILGLPSSGLHSNGFSLVRKILKDLDIDYSSPCPFSEKELTWADVLLEPTRIYVNSVLPTCHFLKAIAHITGGGLIHNVPRILPTHLAAEIRQDSWPKQNIFTWLEGAGNIPKEDMLETFNCGIGLVLVTARETSAELMAMLAELGETAYVIGEVIPRSEKPVVLR
ncbi:phosphoribosylformylglycinamidine cyclo-ligase [Anaplasma phagocytophilum str. Norway variant1]|uniref:Phosphoribosylformylglycinamidine cyclo-ligase n=1 Tax=Anaplasma phagocytophilum str. Norway variant1 TaxID=1392506 RepID=A0A7H9E1E0_ANAPH|nr:phosphoribosylformylglycinamidine cyclo-ligase [Anaplasma phagocytophilum]QLL67239.1 phosphoribosylformylglycinamidine cyclo-ligase [Anaplasma phagocytophilum str. Norway variant1]